jgi:hypothetical protein
MRHLSPDELVDLAEGATLESSNAHLASCVECRRELAELRSLMRTAAAAEVPEPSPLFWDHFSSRVREAVAEERQPRRVRFGGWAVASVLSAAAVVLLVVIRPIPSVDRPQNVPGATASIDDIDDAAIDDPAFTVVSDLAADLDIDTALAAGLGPDGGAEHAVVHMTAMELEELQRLLQEQLGSNRVS